MCSLLKDYCTLFQVNRRIKEREGYAPGTAHHRCKEMSEFTSSLCKDLYLFPKYQPQYWCATAHFKQAHTSFHTGKPFSERHHINKHCHIPLVLNSVSMHSTSEVSHSSLVLNCILYTNLFLSLCFVRNLFDRNFFKLIFFICEVCNIAYCYSDRQGAAPQRRTHLIISIITIPHELIVFMAADS